MKKVILLIVIVFFLAGAYLVFMNRVRMRDNFYLWYRRNTLPKEQEYVPTGETGNKNESPTSTINKTQKTALGFKKEVTVTSTSFKNDILLAEINLAVPFVSQAPLGNWDAVHEETCEEASALMLNGFYKKEKYTRQQMEDELQRIIAWEKDNLGFFEDTTAEETARFMQEIYNLKAVVVYDVTIEDIKKELAAGHPVIIPAAGKVLPNPYFSNGGPVYHMLVLKGYTKDGKFISNDPGTNTLGENFTYKFNDLYNAIHDWVKDGDILTGRKAMIVVR